MIINFGVGDRLTCSSGSLGSGLISTGSATPTSEALLEVRRTGGAGGLSSSSEYILKRHSRVSPAKNITSIRYHKFKLNSLSPPPLHFALLSLALSLLCTGIKKSSPEEEDKKDVAVAATGDNEEDDDEEAA